MRRPTIHVFLWLGLLVALGLVARPSAAMADDDDFIVIVNPKNSATSVERGFLRDAYLKKTTRWNDETLRPIDLGKKFEQRARFTRDVIGKTPTQLKNFWNQQIFSGKGVPPPEADSTAAVIAYVLATPGAIGYLPAGTDPGGAKIVKVK